jgi:transposase-like protein
MLLLTKNASHASGGQQQAMVIREVCPRCQSPKHKKNGHIHNGKQNHQCHDCGRQFVDGFEQDLVSADTRALIERLLVERISLRGICRAVGVHLKWLLGFLAQCFANRVTTLFTSVGNEADRVGATQPIGFTYVDSRALRALDEPPCGSGCWSSRYFPNTVELIPHRGKGCLGEGCNGGFIPNYGERYRHGERISTGFGESTVNQVISKRFCKRQQMQWTLHGAHLLLQIRTRVLNGDWEATFREWYPGFRAAPQSMTA